MQGSVNSQRPLDLGWMDILGRCFTKHWIFLFLFYKQYGGPVLLVLPVVYDLELQEFMVILEETCTLQHPRTGNYLLGTPMWCGAMIERISSEV